MADVKIINLVDETASYLNTDDALYTPYSDYLHVPYKNLKTGIFIYKSM